MTTTLRRDDILIPQGSSFAVFWPDLTVDGVALDATGWTARAQARAKVSSLEKLFEWTTENGGLAYSTVSGSTRLTLFVTPAQSSAWVWKEAAFDIEIVNPASVPIRLTQGRLTVDPEVTRA